jgi:hypothetical protein
MNPSPCGMRTARRSTPHAAPEPNSLAQRLSVTPAAQSASAEVERSRVKVVRSRRRRKPSRREGGSPTHFLHSRRFSCRNGRPAHSARAVEPHMRHHSPVRTAPVAWRAATCADCGATFARRRSGHRFCSDPCRLRFWRRRKSIETLGEQRADSLQRDLSDLRQAVGSIELDSPTSVIADRASLLRAIDSIATQVDHLRLQNSLLQQQLRHRPARSSEC